MDLTDELSPLRFAIPRRTRRLAWLFLALGALLAFSDDRVGRLMAVLNGSVGVALLMTGRPRTVGMVVEDGIALEQGRRSIAVPFETIRGIEPEAAPEGDDPGPFPIVVDHARGVLKIPARPGIESAAIHRAIVLGTRGRPEAEAVPALADYAGRHRAMFGPERVVSYRANPDAFRDVHKRGPWVAVGVAGIVTGAVGLIVSIVLGLPGPERTQMQTVGAVLLGYAAFGTLLAVAFQSRRMIGIKGWKDSGLVLTPVGLALAQGPIKGEMPWDQLRKVTYRKRRHHMKLLFRPVASVDSHLEGIVLVVAGASIVVADLYDRSLPTIHREILRRWRPDPLDSPASTEPEVLDDLDVVDDR